MPPQLFPLPRLLREARVQEVRQPSPEAILLATRGPEGPAHWRLSAHPVGARFTQAFHLGRNAPRPGQFLLWLRTRLVGARVTGLDVEREQVLRLLLGGTQGSFTLALELNGRESNLLLLDEEGTVLTALHPGLPGAAPGTAYVPPTMLHRYGKSDLPRLPVQGDAEARALEARWAEAETTASAASQKTEALRRIRSHVGKLKRRAAKIEEDRAAAQGADRLREQAELLQIHRYRLAPGQSEATVPNEFAEGRPEVRIPLDPSLSPGDNIARLFQRYQKLRDGLAHIERRLADTQAELARWQQVAEALAGAQGEGVAALLATLSPAERKLVDSAAPGRRRSPDAPRPVMTRTSADGFTIYVGRSKTENDEVTFRIGRGRDWWLHALGVPGAHVLVRNPDDTALPPATLRQAAWLAAYYSKGRAQKGLEVTCTQRKHVRKVKGGEPGQVTHALGKTVWVDLDDAQARTILGEVDPGELDV